jgi:hypothetical protein
MRLATTVVLAAAVLVGAPPQGAAAARSPAVEQLVVFRSGKSLQRKVSTAGVRVRVGSRRCAVPSRTPIASLVRARPGRIRFRDFGSCSSRARDAGGIYVNRINREGEAGAGGWVYKVGRLAGTAGGADPSGPLGRGRLRGGQRVTWFWCYVATRCQRTLDVRPRVVPGGVSVTVTGYDDAGKGELIEGATVRVGAATAQTGPDGRAQFAAAPGSYLVRATKRRLVRSFSERVRVG